MENMKAKESLKNAKDSESQVFLRSIRNGDIFPTEYDQDLNFLQREKNQGLY